VIKFFERKYSVVTISLIVNLILFLFKYAIGIRNQSIAIKADAWHTLSDSISSLIVMGGIWISNRPGNEKHPYGFGRFEEMTSILVGAMLALIGYRFFKESLLCLLSPAAAVRYDLSSAVIMILTIILKEGLARLSIGIGKRRDSRALVADGWHHRSDALSSVIILIGIFLNSRLPRIDGVLGIIVAAMILYAAFEIIRDTVKSIMGETIPEKLRVRIEETAREITPEMGELHNFKYHRYGRHVEVSFHGYFPDDIKLKEAHDCVSRLERSLSDIHCLIHPEVR